MEYKDSTNMGLKKIYDKHGLNVMLKVAAASLKSKLYKSNFVYTTTLAGEVCETVLELIILDFISRNPKKCDKWVIGKGIILNDKRNIESNFLTELDLILTTPQMIYLFECKSYKGSNTLTKACTLITDKGKEIDVYRQNKMHQDALETHLEPFRTIIPGKAVQLIMFDFSLGSTKDNRTKIDRSIMPLCNVKNINTLLEVALNLKGTKWDIKYVNRAIKAFELASPKLRKKHIEYVKELHRKE